MFTIFVADDSEIERLIIEHTLKAMGFKALMFINGKEVCDAIYSADKPVIALLDWLMPEQNGVDVTKKIVTEPPIQPVYSIIITSRTKKEDIAFALENGADDFIAKPFDVAELRARINVGIRLLTLHQQLLDSNSNLLEYTKSIEALAEERATQLVQADRLSTIGLLSAGMAHEINNPASFVAVNIQTLEENLKCVSDALKPGTSESEKRKAEYLISAIPEILSEMKNGMARIRSIVNGLKAYTHMTHDTPKLFNIEECIDSALELCRNRLKSITVNKNYHSSLMIYGNMGQIEQVFVNVFTNAVDAIELIGDTGNIFITTDSENGKVIITVRDTGPGIPDYKIEKVFMPFFTTKPVGKGTGLGLSISRSIINDHKGEILFENHPNGGAVFKIVLNAQNEVGL